MKKRELKNRIYDGLLELAPDVYEDIKDESLLYSNRPIESSLEEESDGNDSTKIWFGWRRWTAMACVMVCCLIILFGFQMNKENSMYIVLDVNPSIQLKINKDYEVKSVKGLNADGIDLIAHLNVNKNESIDQALETIITELQKEAYLTEDGGILVTIREQGISDYNSIKNVINDSIEKTVNELEYTDVVIAFQKADFKDKTTGREKLEDTLIKEYGLDEETLANMTVKDIITYCKDKDVDIQVDEGKKSKEKKKQDVKKNYDKKKEVTSDRKTIEEAEQTEDTDIENKEKHENNGKSPGVDGNNGKSEKTESIVKENNKDKSSKEKDKDKKEKKVNKKPEKADQNSSNKGKKK